MAEPTTNAAIRKRYEDGKFLNDGAQGNTATDSPGNGAATAVGADTDVHIVNPDGTNSVDLDAAAEEGREVTVVHNGGSNLRPGIRSGRSWSCSRSRMRTSMRRVPPDATE